MTAVNGTTTKRALVTGGAGFIGSHVVDRLLDDQWEVAVIDNFDPFYSPFLKLQNIASHLDRSGYTFVEADIRDFQRLDSVLSGDFDIVVHLAARTGVRPSIGDPMGYQAVNVRGTQNLLELARRRGIRQFIFGSSSSVYGTNPDVPWHEEDHVLRPISPYAGTKVAAELTGHTYSHLHGIRFIALRFFTVYGPRQRPDLAIHKFARRMLRGEPIPIYGDGRSRRDYTYIDDIVEGVCRAINYTSTTFEVINLGNSKTVELRRLVEALECTLGVKANIEFQAEQPGDVPQTWADTETAYRLLGFRPETPLSTGLDRFASWLQSEVPVSR